MVTTTRVVRIEYRGVAGFCSYLHRKIHILKHSRDPGCLDADRRKNSYPLKIIMRSGNGYTYI
ncbi:hypothetical protein ACRRTK_001460 [Alexandromys fortis]